MASSEQEILSGLAEIVNEETGIDPSSVELGKSFTDDLDIDSLSMMTIVVNAEEKFGVRIPDDDVKNLDDGGRRRHLHPAGAGLTPADAAGLAQPSGRPPALRPHPHLVAGTPSPDHQSDRQSDRPQGADLQMASTSPRIVVTGLGATTPLGGDVPTTWDAALAGRSGARTLTAGLGHRDGPAGHLRGVGRGRPGRALARVETRRLDPSGAVRARRRARGLGRRRRRPSVDPERLGVVIADRHRRRLDAAGRRTTRCKEKGPRRVFPLTVPMLMPNGAGRRGRHRARGPRRRPHAGQRLRVRRRGHRATPRT